MTKSKMANRYSPEVHARAVRMGKAAAAELRWQAPIRLTDKHRARLEWHRSEVFEQA